MSSTAIRLQQHALHRSPFPPGTVLGRTPLAWAAQPCRPPDAPHSRTRQPDRVSLLKFLCEVLIVVVPVLLVCQFRHLLAYRFWRAPCRYFPSIAVHQAYRSFLPVGFLYPPHLAL
jgi:hypothetical protein